MLCRIPLVLNVKKVYLKKKKTRMWQKLLTYDPPLNDTAAMEEYQSNKRSYAASVKLQSRTVSRFREDGEENHRPRTARRGGGQSHGREASRAEP